MPNKGPHSNIRMIFIFIFNMRHRSFNVMKQKKIFFNIFVDPIGLLISDEKIKGLVLFRLYWDWETVMKEYDYFV